MAKIGTRRNKEGQREIIITDINNDLNGLIDVIDEIRKEDPWGKKKIFITESITVNRQIIDRDIDFSNCIFGKKVSFEEITFNGQVDFRGSVFQDETDFLTVTFQEHISFVGVVFEQYVSFKNIFFLQDVNFSNVNFQGSTVFSNVNFQEIVYFDEIIFQNITYFLNVKSRNILSFQYNNFQEIAKFQNCDFHKLVFSNVIFNKSVDFSSSTFQSPQTFYSVSFMDKANFSNTIFKQETKFTDCKVDSKTLISFQCATFKKGLDISTSNFNLCKLNFLGIRIENINEALSSAFYDEKRDNTKPFLSVHHRLRETFRFIKNSLYAENNQIEGLEFHKKEMEVYEKELESKGDEYWQEKIILWFNKMSNNYGTSWLRGVGFTAVWALVILGIILGITTLENTDSIIFNLCDAEAWQQTIKAYIEIINIAKWKDMEPLGYKLSGFGLFFLFVGRIFIGYGYYQTIQAFRKYGK